MSNITYEQFAALCKHWNMTIEEGYKAMSFVCNIVDLNFANRFDYADKIVSDNSHSDVFKEMVKRTKEDATVLKVLYGNLQSQVCDMLTHDEKAS